MDREIDLRELCGRLVLLVAIERDALHRVLAGVLDKMARLHEHPARAAGGVENDAVVGLDDIDDSLDDRGRRKELAIIVRALLRKLGEEVFMDTTKYVAGSRAKALGIEHPQHTFEKIILEAFVILWQLPRERRGGRLDRFHRSR